MGHDWYPSRDEPGEEQPAPVGVERMKPRRDRAREGRANPKGVPHLYVTTDEDTAIAEVRPWVGAYVSLAQLTLRRDIHIIDCKTDGHGLKLYSQEPDPDERERAVWRDIDRGFSPPVTPSDDTADYAPTQVIRQQMGHTSAAMTARYSREIPLEQVKAEFSSKAGSRIVVPENMENEAAA